MDIADVSILPPYVASCALAPFHRATFIANGASIYVRWGVLVNGGSAMGISPLETGGRGAISLAKQ